MSEPRPLKRRIFDVVGVVVLAGLVVFVVALVAVAWWLPDIRERNRERAPERRPRIGFQRLSTTYFDLRFDPDDSRLRWRRAELWAGPAEGGSSSRRRELEMDHPTGRKTGAAPAKVHPRRDEILRDLLATFGYSSPPDQLLAVSRDGRELAFVHRDPAAGEKVIFRPQGGGLRNVTDGPLPSFLAPLSEPPRRPRPERLSSPDDLVWSDAAIESVLNDGVAAGIFVDRLAARPDAQRPVREVLLKIVVRLARDGEAGEAARLLASTSPDPGFQREFFDRLTRGGVQVYSDDPDIGPGDPPPLEPVQVLEALLRRDWGDAPSETLRTWLLRPLEEGTLLKLSPEARDALHGHLKRHAVPAMGPRLAAVIEGPHAAEAGVAAWTLLVLDGKTPDREPSRIDLAAAKEILAELRGRRPELVGPR